MIRTWAGAALACISPHLTAAARDKTAMTSLLWLAVLHVVSSTPPRAKRLAPRPDGPLTHFASPRGEKCRPGQLGGAGQTAAGPAGVAGATKNKLRRRRMGVISPPRFFLRFFLREGKDARDAGGAAAARGERRADGKSIWMIAASLSSCYAGRGSQNKTEGLQCLKPKGNVLLGSPGKLLTLRQQSQETALCQCSHLSFS